MPPEAMIGCPGPQPNQPQETAVSSRYSQSQKLFFVTARKVGFPQDLWYTLGEDWPCFLGFWGCARVLSGRRNQKLKSKRLRGTRSQWLRHFEAPSEDLPRANSAEKTAIE
tara:strand:+ start:148 stop:480 length:333 start_codon:yes stop_codon:yes gene_type:complete